MKKAKIRLIEPGGRPGRPFNAWITRWPLLGPLTLATILENKGYDVQVYNENVSGPLLENPEALEDVASADVAGISIMTPTASRGYAIAEALRSRPASPRIAFGGVHATFCPEEALEHGDIVVQGEGESVIEDIAAGRVTEGIIHGETVEDLDALPTINHWLMRDFDKLIRSRRKRKYYELPVMTSRGCPYGCKYCTVTRMFGRRVRRQSVDKVVGDLAEYTSQGFGRMFFYDDNFTSDRDWTRTLLRRIEPMRLRFNAQVRADFFWLDRNREKCDEDLLRAMRRAGGDLFYIGYETIDDHTAAHWHKGYGGSGRLRARLLEDTRILHKHGFWIHGMFVVGPQHTEHTAESIVEFARRAQIETLQISILTPFPGTPLMEQLRPHLAFKHFPGDWDYFDGTHCVWDHGRLSIEELQNTIMQAHRKFYAWGGWSTRRIRALAEQRIPVLDKVALFWDNARIARKTFKAWRKETQTYIETVRERMRQRVEEATSSAKAKARPSPELA